MKQTAVNWLHHKMMNPTNHELLENINLWFQKAKEMEKEQIIEAFKAGAFHPGYELESEQYYWEKYENKP